jgi:hypothetical protein
MWSASSIKAAIHRNGIHPRRWLTGLLSYSRYLGYVRPQLLRATEEEFRVRRQLLARAVLHVPFCLAPDPSGGTEVYVANLARDLHGSGVDAMVAAPGANVR